MPPRYRVATRTFVYAVDDADFPFEVLSEHKEKDDAWTAFYDAVAASADTRVFIFDISGARVVANSDDFDHLRPIRADGDAERSGKGFAGMPPAGPFPQA